MKYSVRRSAHPARARAPVAGSTSTCSIPGGGRNFPRISPPVAPWTKRRQMGRAPTLLGTPTLRGSSKPTQTAATSSGVNPTNHRSRSPSVVPVFAAMGPRLRRRNHPACCPARTIRKRVPPASSRAVLRVLEIRDYPSVHGVIEGSNMRVIEAGDGSCLALKSLLQLGSL